MAPTTRPRTAPAARKQAVRKASPLLEGEEFEPIRIAADPVEEERTPLFYIGADEYTIPKVIAPGVALEYLRIAGERGEQFAAPILLARVLGEEAYTALEQSRGCTEEQLRQVVQLVVDLSLGRKEKEGKA